MLSTFSTIFVLYYFTKISGGSLIFTDRYNLINCSGDAIQRFEPFDAGGNPVDKDDNVILIQANPNRLIISLFYDPNTSKTYFLTAIPNTFAFDVLFESMNPRLSRTYLYGHGILKMAHDWITGNFYYVAHDNGIGVCSANSCSSPFIKWTMDDTFIGDIEVHPRRGRLFWIEYTASTDRCVIMWSAMDGNEASELSAGMDELKSNITDISVDYIEEVLYFSQGLHTWMLDLKEIFATADFQSKSFAPKPLMNGNAQMPYTRSLIVTKDFYFYIDKKESELVRLQRTSNSVEAAKRKTLRKLNFDSSFLVTTDSSFYSSFANPCANLTCDDICVLRASVGDALPTPRCGCPPTKMSTAEGKCIPYTHVDMLLTKRRHLTLDNLFEELTEHRLKMEGNSLGISWALIFYATPSIILNLALCGALIHVIVTDYVDYLKVINE